MAEIWNGLDQKIVSANNLYNFKKYIKKVVT